MEELPQAVSANNDVVPASTLTNNGESNHNYDCCPEYSRFPYSPNPEVEKTLRELLAIGCPPIPVAPAQANNPKFGGKNPSYLDTQGNPRFCKHKVLHDRLPTHKELVQFFSHKDTGIGTLGGHAGIDWLDFDAKCYASQSDCDTDCDTVINNICVHTGCDRSDLWIEQTGSKGYRVAVIPKEKPTFTNFATSPGGKHVGEALFKGRFTVLAPSIHPNGNSYQRLEFGKPIAIESLEAIGIYPAAESEKVKAAKKAKAPKKKAKAAKAEGLKPNTTNQALSTWFDALYPRLDTNRLFGDLEEGFQGLGNNSWCPFCTEKEAAPSMGISEYKFHCFGCESAGTWLQYYQMRHNNCSTFEAMKALAAEAGVDMPDMSTLPQTEEEEKAKKEQWEAYKAEQDIIERDIWRNTYKYTADITYNLPYLNIQDVPLEGILRDPAKWLIAIKSGLGTNKTGMLADDIAKYMLKENIFLAGFRNGLNSQTMMRFNEALSIANKKAPLFTQLNDERNLGGLGAFKLGGCMDSSHKFGNHLHLLSGTNIVMDEADSVVLHTLLGSTCRRERRKILRVLGEMVRRCRRIIVLSGNLADWVIDLLCKLRGVKDREGVYAIENIYNERKFSITSYVQETALLTTMREYASKGKRFVLGVDSQTAAEALEREIKGINPKLNIWRQDSKTSPTPEGIAFANDPNKFLVENSIDVLIYTSTMESGVDINLKEYFKAGFYIFSGVLGVDAIEQMIGRLRDVDCPRYVWVAGRGLGNPAPLTPDAVYAHAKLYIELVEEELNTNMPPELYSIPKYINQEEISVYTSTLALLRAKEAYEIKYLRYCFLERIGAKHNLTIGEEVPTEDALIAHLGVKKGIKEENLTELYKAEVIDEAEAESIQSNPSALWKDRVKVKKYYLLNQLPGIAEEEIVVKGVSHPAWSLELVKEAVTNKIIDKTEMYFLLMEAVEADKLGKRRLIRELEQHSGTGQEMPLFTDIKAISPAIQAMIKMGIPKLFEEGQTFDKDSEIIKAIHTAGKGKRISTALGGSTTGILNWEKDAVGYTNKVLALSGHRLGRKEIGGVYKYVLTPIHPIFHPPILNCVTRRFLSRIEFHRDKIGKMGRTEKEDEKGQNVYAAWCSAHHYPNNYS